MHVLVVDPVHNGHHLPYVAGCVAGVRQVPGARVTVLLGAAAQGTPEFRQYIEPLTADINIRCELGSVTYGKFDLIQYTRRMFGAVAACKPDAVLMPSGDPFVQIASSLGWMGLRSIPRGVMSEACVHRCAFAYPKDAVPRSAPDSIARAGLASRQWGTVHVVDHLAYEHLRSMGGKLAAKVCMLPDPIEQGPVPTREQARAALGVTTDGRMIGCAGLLDTRKGVDHLLRAFAAAAAVGAIRQDDRLLLAGRASDQINQILKTNVAGLVREGRIIVLDKYLSEQELVSALAAMDVVCTAHPRHVGISNICLRALAAGKPVLGSDFGWQGYFIPKLGLGAIVNVRDTPAFARSIAGMLDASAGFRRTPAHEKLLAFHHPDNFAKMWTRGLRARLGLPAPEGLVTWEGVW